MLDQDTAFGDGRFAIRPFSPADGAELYVAIRESQPELGRWMPNLHGELTEPQIVGWINGHPAERAEGRAEHWLIADAVDGRPLGGVGLTHINPMHRFANLYYWVRGSARGRGAASAGARLLARYALARLGLSRIEIVMAVDNHASIRAAERAGAVFEGVLRQRLGYHDGNYDARMYSLVADDLSQ